MGIRTLAMPMFLLAALAANARAGCENELANLATDIPASSDPELGQIRASILSRGAADIIEPGSVSPEVPRRELAAAQGYAKQMAESEACIRQASTEPDGVLASIQAGTYDYGAGSGDSVLTNCARLYAQHYYGYLASGAAARFSVCVVDANVKASPAPEAAGPAIQPDLGRLMGGFAQTQQNWNNLMTQQRQLGNQAATAAQSYNIGTELSRIQAEQMRLQAQQRAETLRLQTEMLKQQTEKQRVAAEQQRQQRETAIRAQQEARHRAEEQAQQRSTATIAQCRSREIACGDHCPALPICPD